MGVDGKICWDCKEFVPFVLDNGKLGWYKRANRCYKCKSKYNKSKDNLKNYMPLWARDDVTIKNEIKKFINRRNYLNQQLKKSGSPGKYVLDHIIPRNGYRNGVKEKYVTGLHMPNNLSVEFEHHNVKWGNVFSEEAEEYENKRLIGVAHDTHYIDLYKSKNIINTK